MFSRINWRLLKLLLRISDNPKVNFMCHYHAINLSFSSALSFTSHLLVLFVSKLILKLLKLTGHLIRALGQGIGLTKASTPQPHCITKLSVLHRVIINSLSCSSSTHPRSNPSSRKLETLVPFSLVASSELSP